MRDGRDHGPSTPRSGSQATGGRSCCGAADARSDVLGGASNTVAMNEHTTGGLGPARRGNPGAAVGRTPR